MKMWQASPFFAKPNFCNSKCFSVSCVAPTSLYACVTKSRHAPNETTDGALCDFLPDLCEGIPELLYSLRR